MKAIQYRHEVERTNLFSILVSILIAIAGLGLLFWSNEASFWSDKQTLQGVIRDLGSLMIVSVAIAFIWELIAKRVFVDELLIKARISQELSTCGVLQISYEPHQINWDELFSNSKNLDILFAYGRTWRGTHENKIRKLAAIKGATIRIFLPDPENDIIIKDLSKRFHKTEDGIKNRILEAKRDFTQIKQENINSGSNIEIYYVDVSLVFTLYKFDSAMVISLYSYSNSKGGVPHFVAGKGGSLYTSMCSEFDELANPHNSLSRRVE